MAPENNIEDNANAKSVNVSTINIEAAQTSVPEPTTATPISAPITMIAMPISMPPTSMPMSMTVTIPTSDTSPVTANAVAPTEEAAAEAGTAEAEIAAAEAAAAAVEVAVVEAAAAAAESAEAEVAAAAAAVAAAEAASAAVASAVTAAAIAAGAAVETIDIKTTKTINLNANLQSNGENNGNVVPQMNVEAAATAIPEQQQQQLQQETQTENHKGKMDRDSTMLANFKVLYVLTQLCGLTMVLLVGSWVGVHMGGLAGPSDPKHEFNWHPLLMTIGLIFLYGNSILVYRGFRTTRKKTLKISHASIHMIAFILTVIALKTVFDSHNLNDPAIPNMYSLHSWLGLSAVLLFCLQYVAGFMSYMVPGLKENYKIAYMPFHIYFGLFGFVLAIASALMGVTEKAIFSSEKYSEMPSSAVTANMCGLMFVVFAGLVVYLATEPAYKRKPIPEDAVLLTGANE